MAGSRKYLTRERERLESELAGVLDEASFTRIFGASEDMSERLKSFRTFALDYAQDFNSGCPISGEGVYATLNPKYHLPEGFRLHHSGFIGTRLGTRGNNAFVKRIRGMVKNHIRDIPPEYLDSLSFVESVRSSSVEDRSTLACLVMQDYAMMAS